MVGTMSRDAAKHFALSQLLLKIECSTLCRILSRSRRGCKLELGPRGAQNPPGLGQAYRKLWTQSI